MAVASETSTAAGSAPTEPVPVTTQRTYGKIILTLENCLLPEEKLSPTPSVLDGLDLTTEKALRYVGCELIQTSGILLKLPQVAMATGQVLFHRFYYSKSFVRHPMETTAMACVCLASKIEEAPRRTRDVINVFHHIRQVRSGRTINPVILDGNYINLKNQVIKAERRILKELGFCVHVKHPHKIIVMYLQVLECEKNERLMQIAWNYMNDSLRSDLFVRYTPETIACACIYLAARMMRLPLPRNPPWFHIFHAKESDIQDISLNILSLYKMTKPDVDRLERIVEDLRKAHQEAKFKERSGLTPLGAGGFSPHSRPASPVRPSSAVPTMPKKVPEGGLPPPSDPEPQVNGDSSNREKEKGKEDNNHVKRGTKRSETPSRSRSHSRSGSPRKAKRRRKHSHSSSGSREASEDDERRKRRREASNSRQSGKRHARRRSRSRSLSSLSLSPPLSRHRKSHKDKGEKAKYKKSKSKTRKHSHSRSPSYDGRHGSLSKHHRHHHHNSIDDHHSRPKERHRK